MNKYDLEHKLLRGSVLYLDEIPTYRITLGEMADAGFSKLQNVISILCMDDDKANELLTGAVENPNTFMLIMLNMLQEHAQIKKTQVEPDHVSNSLFILIPAFLNLFFRKKVVFHQDYGFIIGDDNDKKYVLNHLNYDNFREILKQRNCLVDLDDVDECENPSGEMAKKLLEKRKKLREKVKKAKSIGGDDDSLTMTDLISIFAQAEHMSLQEVYESYDIYQFNNQFNRLKIMDDFHVNIQALIAGAKSEDVKLQHWLSKIKKPND
ncbi:hypothetical protein [Lacrimispora sp.]|uniref:hypothetical protein n=1 Tax=Lacrimispora sp. TaxID=2719234 RepID=UPI003460C9B5